MRAGLTAAVHAWCGGESAGHLRSMYFQLETCLSLTRLDQSRLSLSIIVNIMYFYYLSHESLSHSSASFRSRLGRETYQSIEPAARRKTPLARDDGLWWIEHGRRMLVIARNILDPGKGLKRHAAASRQAVSAHAVETSIFATTALSSRSLIYQVRVILASYSIITVYLTTLAIPNANLLQPVMLDLPPSRPSSGEYSATRRC